MKLDEIFNDDYTLNVFNSRMLKLNESEDSAYLVKVRQNIIKCVKNLESELPSLKREIDSGSLELKPLYSNLAHLLQWLKPLLDHLSSYDDSPVPSRFKDHPFWGQLPAFAQ